jgi:uncharacterized membrane protein YphA (DoxX/SURF4 family)
MACAVLSALFVLAALPKLLGVDLVAEAFQGWEYPVEFMYVVGLLELSGAFLILIPTAARFGFAMLIFVMCGAVVTHLMDGEIGFALIPLVMVAALAIVAKHDKSSEELLPKTA